MEEKVPLKRVIAKRELFIKSTERRVLILIGTPQYIGDGWDWVCPYEIQGIGKPIYNHSHGIDALQALQLIGQSVRATLRDSGEDFIFLDSSNWESGFPGNISDLGDRELRERLESLMTVEITKWVSEKATSIPPSSPTMKKFNP